MEQSGVRISRQQMFMEMAEAAAKRSTCFRLNVGAILVINNNVESIGYNGAPSGEPHCTGNACPGRDHCRHTVHAEENAIKRAIFTYQADMYVTDSPCDACASMIQQCGIRRLFFKTPYRIITPLEKLVGYGVEVYKVTPAGFVVNWATNEIVEIN